MSGEERIAHFGTTNEVAFQNPAAYKRQNVGPTTQPGRAMGANPNGPIDPRDRRGRAP